MIADIVIFGAGGHAKVVIESARAGSPDARLAIADDSAAAVGRVIAGVGVMGGREWLADNPAARGVVPALGDNACRFELLEWLVARGLVIITVVDPTAVVSPSASLGSGVFLAPGAIVNAEAYVADGVIINTAASVDHDCQIGPAAHVAPGSHLCGNVRVGARALIGAGTTIIPGVRIGDDAVIGAGSTIIRDVPDGARVVGSPGKAI